MDVKISDTWEYVPEYNGNKDSKNPIKATLRHITVEERDECYEYVDSVGGMRPVRSRFVEKGLVKLANCLENGKEIKNGVELLKSKSYYGLYTELFVELLTNNALMEEDRKNSESPSTG